MEKSTASTLYKIEGIFISLLMIASLVIFYYHIIDKYILTTMLLGMSAALFSINTSLQRMKESVVMFKLNILLTYIFCLAGVAFTTYFYAKGFLVF